MRRLGIISFFALLLLAYSSGLNGHSCSGMHLYNLLNLQTHVSDSGLLLYDVHHYNINLEISDTSTYLKGYSEVLATVLGTLDELVIELSSDLVVDSVILEDRAVNDFTHESDLIRIEPPEPVRAGDRFFLRVYYHGIGGQSGIFAGISNRTDKEWGNRVTYTLSEPFRALDWFACKQVLSDKADSADINITVDEGLMAGSNGLLVRVDSLPGNKIRYNWRTRYPVAYYLLSISVSRYTDYSIYTDAGEGNDSILIQNFIYDAPDYLERNREQIDATADLIRLYSDLFSDYPFAGEKYGHCLAPMGGGMEHQTMTTLSGFGFNLVAHELTHQWFGDHVTCAGWQDVWVNEGFASYGEYLALEFLRTPREAAQWMEQAHLWALSEPQGSVYIPVADANDPVRIFSRSLSYKKGAALLHMIRYELGNDSVFFETLARFQDRYADSIATGRDFLEVLNETSGNSYDWFFDQWYYGQGFPYFQFIWWQERDSVIIEIRQTPSSMVTPFFRTKLGLALQYEGGGDTLVQTRCDSSYMRIGIRLDRPVSAIIPDPDNWVLETSEVIKKSYNAGYFSVHPNPFGNELRVLFRTGSNKREIRLSDLTGKVLVEQSSAEGTVTLDTRNLRQGLYLLQVMEGKERYTAKVVRQ